MRQSAVIRENREFLRLYKKGKNRVHPLLVTYYRPNGGGMLRYGITASKKVGGAVQRNRAKRVIRAAFRAVAQDPLLRGDFIFVARSRTVFAKTQEVQKVMKAQIDAVTAQSGKSGG